MRNMLLFFTLTALLAVMSFSYTSNSDFLKDVYSDSLRNVYSKPISEWPKPTIDEGAIWSEFAAMPEDTTWKMVDNDPVTKLGMILFFDPRLSRSDQISCSSCHDPDLGWQDGRVVSLGNDHLQGTRNTPSLLNTHIYPKLFWDGRAAGYQAQMVGPLAAHHEMDMNLKILAKKIGKVDGYKDLFKKAYGEPGVTLDKIGIAMAAFEKTIRSRSTRFDLFLRGQTKVLNDDEIAGLHLFRTKARCMNCHNGTFLTDTSFHNIGLTYYKRKYEDLGLYKITKKAEDVGRFRTPSLRELLHTRPWMHNGLFNSLEGIVNIYNSGMPLPPRTDSLKNDPLYPKTDKLIKKLDLTDIEKKQVVAFLQTMDGVPYRMRRPELPK